mgnify:FL=1
MKFDRDEIHILIRKKYTQQDIADRLSVTQGAISEELRKNTRKGRLYDAKYAQHKSDVNRRHKQARSNTIALHKDLRKTVEE